MNNSLIDKTIPGKSCSVVRLFDCLIVWVFGLQGGC